MADGNGALPEFTRALRALGSRRGRRGARAAGPDQQARFFAPLVGARSQAALTDDASNVVAAFDATTMRVAFTATLDGFARDRYPDYAPARRALEAEVFEVAEPLFAALEAVTVVASRAGATHDAQALAEWARVVQRLFETADRVWVLLDDVLETASTSELAPPKPAPRRVLRPRQAP